MGLFQVFTCGDLCEITYNNYIHTDTELKVLQATLTGPQTAKRDAMPLGAPWVGGGYKYLPSEVMGLDASNEKGRTKKQADQACPHSHSQQRLQSAQQGRARCPCRWALPGWAATDCFPASTCA